MDIDQKSASVAFADTQKEKENPSQDSKEEIRRDVFTTQEEAEDRAKEIGCVGFHEHDEDGNKIFMPCENHEDYIEAVGRDVSADDEYQDAKKDLPQNQEIQAEIKAVHDEEEEGYGKFEGYGSVFGNKDLGNDVIERGAFAKSLKRKKPKNVKLLYQHKSDMPIGVFDEIKEDDHGLFVKGRLALNTQAGKEAYELMKMGALDGLSIGFKVNPDMVSYDKRSMRRHIKEVDLMEVSLVTFPMNPKATIRAVKARDLTIREWENGLRDAFNLSRSEAKVVAGAITKSFDDQRDAEAKQITELVDTIKELTLTLKS